MGKAGLFLALLAGMVVMGLAIWPIGPPQARVRGELSSLWIFVAFVLGGAFIAAGALADRHPGWAKTILFGGGLILAASALVFGLGLGPQGGRAALYDLIPALLAIVAAILIRPIRREERIAGMGLIGQAGRKQPESAEEEGRSTSDRPAKLTE